MSDQLNDCGCCAGLTAQTPAEVANRPGLPAIAYRVGTHSQFKQSMLAALSDTARSRLRALTARSDDDFSIALLDAAATLADVLTFYQERIANESYLRTATERRSLVELARLIGYELRTGVAAEAFLAFTVDETPGAPNEVVIEAGSKVQSVPGPNEAPQTFETVEKITARAEWNALRPPMTRAWSLRPDTRQVYLKGTGTNLRRGDLLLLVSPDSVAPHRPRGWSLRRVIRVVPEPEFDRTRVEWDRPSGLIRDEGTLPTSGVQVYALRVRAALFGHNAPQPRGLSQEVLDRYDGEFAPSWPSDWNYTFHQREIDLDTTYPGITEMSWLVLSAFVDVPSMRARDTQPSPGQVTGGVTDNVPDPVAGGSVGTQPEEPVIGGGGTIGVGTPGGTAPPVPRQVGYELFWVRGTADTTGAKYAIAGRTTRITLDRAPMNRHFGNTHYRETAVLAQSEPLAVADEPIPGEIPSPSPTLELAQTLTEEGRLRRGQRLIASGMRVNPGERGAEVVHLATSDGRSLTVTPPLAQAYVRDSLSLNANIAHATHGETVEEILGSGDASQANQRFTLRQAPLTHLQARTTGGAKSTLEVRVNEVLWHETPTLYGRGPREHVYTLRTDDDGRTSIEFGDGINGARLPTGLENIRARYRKGIGIVGNVKIGQLSLPLTRPLGVKAVTNPLDALGAEDRESLTDARRNAPTTVRTLDRAVSLQDYEDFARAFAGIAKALATWTWDGQARRVFVTVAGPGGTAVSPETAVYRDLVGALREFGDPFVPLTVQSFGLRHFDLAGRVTVKPDHRADDVLSAVKSALRSRFSFANREFGQPVALSEVISVIQAVAGVFAVNLQRFNLQPSNRTDQEPAMASQLPPHLPAELPLRRGDGTMTAAGLLILADTSLTELRAAP